MKKQSVLKAMRRENRHLVYNYLLAYFAMGLYLMLIGAALPMIKTEYQLSYRVSGMMLSVQSMGYLVVGALVGILPRYFGVKKTSIVLGNLAFIGLALIMITGNPVVLLAAMLFTGISKGSTCNFGNQIVSCVSASDAGLLNLSQAYFAIGACVAPMIAMACGAAWRTSFAIAIAIGIVSLLYNLRRQYGSDAYVQTDTGKLSFSFFREKIFWLCAVILLCYLAVESSVMGWLVTYFVDSGAAGEATAQLLATALWGALLIGRFASAWFAQRFPPHQMIAVMTAGVTVCFTALMFSRTLLPMAVSAIGLGLFMAGMYGTAIAGSGELIEKNPMCMGMFIAIPGIGAVVAPSAVGIVSDRIGIHGGMCTLYALIAVLIVATILLVVYQTGRQKNNTKA